MSHQFIEYIKSKKYVRSLENKYFKNKKIDGDGSYYYANSE